MHVNRFYIFSLILLSLILGYLVYQVLRPFLTAIAWAAVLSILFYPVYAFLSSRIRWNSVAAALTLVIILAIIIGPFSYLSILLVGELKSVAGYIEDGQLDSISTILEHPYVAWFVNKITPIFNAEEVDLGAILIESISNLGQVLLGKITSGAKNLVMALLNFIFMSLTIFFFLRDGSSFLARFRDYMPWSDEHKARLESQTKDMVFSTIFGGVVVALIQGLLGGVAFFLVGVPEPVIWGIAISIMSFIPMLGTFSIWGPAVIYLVLQDMLVPGFVLLIIGTFGISMVDNILKPIIIGGRTKMPTLLIFFAVLGGMKLFGIIGLIMGPLVMALFISVLGIFRNIEEDEQITRPRVLP